MVAREPKSQSAGTEAFMMTADFSQLIDFADNEESKKGIGASAKRTTKAMVKTDAKKVKAA